MIKYVIGNNAAIFHYFTFEQIKCGQSRNTSPVRDIISPACFLPFVRGAALQICFDYVLGWGPFRRTFPQQRKSLTLSFLFLTTDVILGICLLLILTVEILELQTIMHEFRGLSYEGEPNTRFKAGGLIWLSATINLTTLHFVQSPTKYSPFLQNH